ncbi:hypothetical protein PT974_08596 [Cladobotryum mycophilum]|uniref:Protein kinase domain-containing protein n=1 Tax=Cladobotryum mycophilum TaxID=491253 RepID=A0ABR0SDV6_9HYPO
MLANRGPDRPRWKPLPDPQRLQNPYQKNTVLFINRHIPPRHSAQTTRKKHGAQEPVSRTNQIVHALKVVDILRYGLGSQILRCQLGEDTSQEYVAKVYDPLYYQYGPDRPDDVTWRAEHDYSREAAAYEELDAKGVAGAFTPKYFGSWTFDMPLVVEPYVARPVRMILLGWIEGGVTMKSLVETNRVKNIPPNQRLEILAKAMEVECGILFHGVNQRDFAPRNIILAGPDVENEMPDIYLFNFNASTVFSRPNFRYPKPITSRAFCPRYRYWGQCPAEFVDWVPKPHRTRRPAFLGWLKTRWLALDESTGTLGTTTRPLKDFDEPVEFCPPEWDTD